MTNRDWEQFLYPWKTEKKRTDYNPSDTMSRWLKDSQSKATTPPRFYLVTNENNVAVSKRLGKVEAEKEALRLAELAPGFSFYVLESIAIAEKPKAPGASIKAL